MRRGGDDGDSDGRWGRLQSLGRYSWRSLKTRESGFDSTISVASVRETAIILGIPNFLVNNRTAGKIGKEDKPYHCPAILYLVSQQLHGSS